MTTTNATDRPELAVLDDIKGTRDALSVKRVFGDPYTANGVTIIPVARIAGGAGGGGGEGTGPQREGGHGFGTGFGIGARPLGVYEIRDATVRWKPIVDVDQIAKGSQVLAGIAAICVALVLLRRR